MKHLFTLILTFIGLVSYGQTFVMGLELANPSEMRGGCASGCSSFCTVSGSGSISVYVTLTENISIPSGDYANVTITSNDCNVTGGSGLDANDLVTINGTTISSTSGPNNTLNYSGCFHNDTGISKDVPVVLRVNRRDETITVTYSFSSTDPGGCLVLPIEMKSFTTTSRGTTNILDFTTASEINNDYFTIERASNGGAFEPLGTIIGAGDSKADINYTYTDLNPSAGINHYRIMQTDYDGKYSYSAVRSVRNTLDGKLVISPRTTEGTLNILTDLENYDIQVYDLSGQEVYKSTNNSADLEINIDNVRAGIYFVKVTNGYTTEVTKIMKI